MEQSNSAILLVRIDVTKLVGMPQPLKRKVSYVVVFAVAVLREAT